MPYLEPECVLEEFAEFAIDDVRPALDEDEAFVHGQVGSMASTLRFLASELAGREDAVATQKSALEEALTEASQTVADPGVREVLADALDSVTQTSGRPSAVEPLLLEVADEAFEAVDTLEEPAAREARAPLYRFLDERLEAQFAVLGRSTDG